MARYASQHTDPLRSDSRYLSPDAVADFTGLSIHTLAHWRGSGRGPAFHRIGEPGRNCRVRYDRDDVEAWLSSCRRTTSETPSTPASKPVRRRPESRNGE